MAKILLIVNIISENYQESLNTLQFADKFRSISQTLHKTTLTDTRSLLLQHLREISSIRADMQTWEITLARNIKSQMIINESEIQEIENTIENMQAKLELLQSSILVAEQLRDIKMLSIMNNEDLLIDFKCLERSSLRLKF